MNIVTTIPFTGFYNEPMTDNYNFESSEDWGKFFLEFAKGYVQNLNEYIKDETGIDLKLAFESLDSPKEYNFTTDRIFAYADPHHIRRLLNIAENGDEVFRKVARERFTSRDGFISSYHVNPDQWTKHWDYNQWGTLLLAAMEANLLSTEYDLFLELWEMNSLYEVIDNYATPYED